MDFKERLKDLREIHELTQSQLAKKIGVSRATISGYETKGNQPDYERLMMLSDELNVSIDYLIRGEENETMVYESQIQHKEQLLDRKVKLLYKQLSIKDKHALLEYMEYLNYRETK